MNGPYIFIYLSSTLFGRKRENQQAWQIQIIVTVNIIELIRIDQWIDLLTGLKCSVSSLAQQKHDLQAMNY